MNSRIYGPLQPPILPIDKKPSHSREVAREQTKDFAAALEKAQGELKFSRHARERLQTRNIPLTMAEVGRLQLAIEKAEGKGARETLVLLDETAFLVSVKNRTVITVLAGESIKQHVFTNIDSAVIVK